MRAERAPQTVAILILSGAKSGFPLSEIYGATRRPLEEHTALKVAPLEAIGLDERDAAIRDCAGDAECFVRRVRAARDDVDLLLTVSVDRPDDVLLLGLRLIDTHSREQLGAIGSEVPFGMSLDGALEDRLPDVVPPRIWGDISSLAIQSSPESAEVWVGDLTCITPCRIERLLPGRYEVLIRKSGREPWREDVELQRGRNTVEADLFAPGGSLLESPWFWTAVGAVVVAGGVTTYVLLQEPERRGVVCFSPRPEFCPSGP